MSAEREARVWHFGGDGPWSRAFGVAAGTCAWASGILLALVLVAAVVGLVSGLVVGLAGPPGADALDWATSTGLIGMIMWLMAAVVVWVGGLPAGTVLEWAFNEVEVALAWRVAALAALGGFLAFVAAVAVGVWTWWPGMVLFLVVVGAVAGGGGRLADARRRRRRGLAVS